MNSIKATVTHFRYKKHPGDLFRDTSVQLLPHPYKNQSEFWVWFHPSYHRSEDIADLNELYKQLQSFSCQEEIMGANPELCYAGITREHITEEIKLLEHKIYQDCFENFYLLLIEGHIELIENQQQGKNESAS